MPHGKGPWKRWKRFSWDMKHLKHLFYNVLHIRILNLDYALCVAFIRFARITFLDLDLYGASMFRPQMRPSKWIGSNMAAAKLKTQYLVRDLKTCWGSVKWSFTKIGSKGLKLSFPLNNVYKDNKLIQSVNKTSISRYIIESNHFQVKVIIDNILYCMNI